LDEYDTAVRNFHSDGRYGRDPGFHERKVVDGMSDNKNQLEVFFDYSCPYCKRGHDNLLIVYKEFKDLEIVWRPCEAHPRPEKYGRHSDLCIMGLFYAMDNGADVWAYHEAMYKAGVTDKADIENICSLSEYVKTILNVDGFKKALQDNVYQQRVLDYNDYAYERSGVWAVPSYRMNGKKLDAKLGVGVSRDELLEFVKNGIDANA